MAPTAEARVHGVTSAAAGRSGEGLGGEEPGEEPGEEAGSLARTPVRAGRRCQLPLLLGGTGAGGEEAVEAASKLPQPNL